MRHRSLKIGEFARRGHVTVKALRHYDEEGLLAPAFVEPGTGYRHYAPEQLGVLLQICLLKDLGFALSEIRRLLGHPGELRDAVAARRRALTERIVADRLRLRRLESFHAALRAKQPCVAPAIVLRTLRPVLALTAREIIRGGDGRLTALFEALEARAAQSRARANTPPFLLLHHGGQRAGRCDRDRLDVEVCIPLTAAGRVLPGARVVEGCRRAGALVYRGSYAQSANLFARLARWVDTNGGKISGPLREVYHRFGADQRGYSLPDSALAQEPAGYVTELQAPIL